MLNFAIETARDAGQLLLEKFGKKLKVSKKGDINLVTEADLASKLSLSNGSNPIIQNIRSSPKNRAMRS